MGILSSLGLGSSDEHAPPAMVATQAEMNNAKLDIGYRDFCAHLLIPLNECRRASFYMPWSCGDERHKYEKCQYLEYKRRVAKMDAARTA
jgi:NADH dehydrogenase (ubiquinone) 1 beta subcomplex subunit 7